MKNKTIASRSRTAIIVLGMHRSGTSAAAGLLSEMGCDLPNNLMAPHEMNAKGFFESNRLTFLNDAILASAGLTWFDQGRFPERWYSSPKAPEFRDQARAAFQEEFGGSGLFVLKDPRHCRLVPFWEDVFAEQMVQPVYVCIHRNPVEVAASLEKWQRLDLLYGQLLWLRHVLDAEITTRGKKRVFISYDQMLTDWREVVSRISNILDLTFPRSLETSVRGVHKFLSGKLKHFAAATITPVELEDTSDWLHETFEVLTRWAKTGEDTAGHTTLDQVRDALNAASPTLMNLANQVLARHHETLSHSEQIALVNATLADTEEAHERMSANLTVVNAALADKELENERMSENLAVINAALADKEEEQKRMSTNLTVVNAALAEKEEEQKRMSTQLANAVAFLPEQSSDLAIQVSGLAEQISHVISQLGLLTHQMTQPVSRTNSVRRSFISRMSFRSSGKPRGWLRFLLLKDQKLGTPRKITRRILVKKNGQVRPNFRDWYHRYEISPDNTAVFSYMQMLRDQFARGKLEKAKTVCVVCTCHTTFIAEAIIQALKGTRLKINYVTEMPDDFEQDLYIVIAAQMFDRMPPSERCIIFQTEQVRVSHWIDDAYVERLRNCLAVIDYAFDNITALTEKGLLLKQLFYVPIQPFANSKVASTQRDIDVLFYGANGSPRRDRYLAALSRHLNIRIETNLFGDQMSNLLSRSKIVVNIHYYENALLETTRVSEALSHGAFVVSEQSSDPDMQNDFDGLVDFVASDDVETFVKQVENRLSQWTAATIVKPRDDVGSMKFLLLRALHGFGVLSYTEFSEATHSTQLPSDSLILGLPEEAPRRLSAQQNRLPGFVAFPALRHVEGWKGCAQSYKYMASKSTIAGFPLLKICEDDAIFSAGTAERLGIVTDYLLQEIHSWDVFSGLLTDLSIEAKISEVTDYGGEKFVHLDSLIGMVFGIYNRSFIEKIANFEFLGEDSRYHTIDRYLESTKPRCITTIPPIAQQSSNFHSTLWLAHNQQMTDMISASLHRLENKVRDFTDSVRP